MVVTFAELGQFTTVPRRIVRGKVSGCHRCKQLELPRQEILDVEVT